MISLVTAPNREKFAGFSRSDFAGALESLHIVFIALFRMIVRPAEGRLANRHARRTALLDGYFPPL